MSANAKWLLLVVMAVSGVALALASFLPSPVYLYEEHAATGVVVSYRDSLKEWNRNVRLRIDSAVPPLDDKLESDYYHGSITTGDKEILYKSSVGDRYHIVFMDQIQLYADGTKFIQYRTLISATRL